MKWRQARADDAFLEGERVRTNTTDATGIVLVGAPAGSLVVRIEVQRQPGIAGTYDYSNIGDVHDVPIEELLVLRDD